MYNASAGSCFGFLETFLFWLLQDLGAKKYLMGITVTVGSMTGIPFLAASSYIFKKLGLVNTIIVGMAFYAIRFMGKFLVGDGCLLKIMPDRVTYVRAKRLKSSHFRCTHLKFSDIHKF